MNYLKVTESGTTRPFRWPGHICVSIPLPLGTTLLGASVVDPVTLLRSLSPLAVSSFGELC